MSRPREKLISLWHNSLENNPKVISLETSVIGTNVVLLVGEKTHPNGGSQMARRITAALLGLFALVAMEAGAPVRTFPAENFTVTMEAGA